MRLSVLVGVVAASVAIPGAALACICGLVPTAYTCPACPTVAATGAGCPVPTTATTVRRCYYEPRTTYRKVVQRVPQLTWAQQCVYDPIFGVTRSILVPTVAYVEQELQIPETTYVERCEYVQPAAQNASESKTPPTEVLPEGATQQRYYYRPERQQPPQAGESGSQEKTEEAAPQPGELPPPPLPDGEQQQQEQQKQQPGTEGSEGASGSQPGTTKLVHVQWRPVWRPVHSVARDDTVRRGFTETPPEE